MHTDSLRLRTLVQIVFDCLCLAVIWQGTIQCRVLLNPVMNVHVTALQASTWAPPLSLILVFWLVVSVAFGLQQAVESLKFWEVAKWSLESTVVLTTITAATTFFSREFGNIVSRVFVPAMVPVSFLCFIAGRFAAARLMRLAEQRYGRPHRVALIGDWRNADALIAQLEAMPANKICGVIVSRHARTEHARTEVERSPLPVLGTVDRIAELINTERLDRVFVLNSTLPGEELEHCSQVFERMGLPMSCALEAAHQPVRVDLSTEYGLPFVEMEPVQFTRQQHVIKRVFDVVVSSVSLIVLAPVLVGIAAAIKLTSTGPVLYCSSRVGKGGRHFTFLKFRSMYVGNQRARVAQKNEKSGHIFKMRNDPRVTPVGRFLRRYSLDELPQLINVLRGEMSIVGPRPLPACDLDPDGMSKEFALWSEKRACVPPGLTGLWQVSGRSDLSFEDMVRLDLAYIQNWSLALDARIIFDTPMLILRGVGAY